MEIDRILSWESETHEECAEKIAFKSLSWLDKLMESFQTRI